LPVEFLGSFCMSTKVCLLCGFSILRILSPCGYFNHIACFALKRSWAWDRIQTIFSLSMNWGLSGFAHFWWVCKLLFWFFAAFTSEKSSQGRQRGVDDDAMGTFAWQELRRSSCCALKLLLNWSQPNKIEPHPFVFLLWALRHHELHPVGEK